VILTVNELSDLDKGMPSPGVFAIQSHRSKLAPPLTIGKHSRIGLNPLLSPQKS